MSIRPGGIRLSTIAAVGLVAVLPLVVGGPATAQSGTPNPVISSVAPDPSALRGTDGAFHIYASSDDWSDGAGYRLIPHFRSFDLVEWEYVGDAFGSRPSWATRGGFLWAPDVHVVPGGAVMYYTTGGSVPCIGRATAPGPEGPWTHASAPIVCHGADAPYQDLDPMDPEVVFTDDGPVMFMGNFEGIHAVPMNAGGTALAGDPILVAGTGVEAPAIVTRDGYTHLFTSAGNCCTGESSQYRVLGGRADALMGPYVDRQERPLVQAGAGDPVLRGDESWVGPGHVGVVTDDAGQDWMLYHAAPRGSAVLPNGVQRRYMLLDRLDWVDDWPVVGDGTPSTVRPADPSVTLPVRLTAAGDVVRGADDAGPVLQVPVRLDSTGSAYEGELRAGITGPSKTRVELPVMSGEGTVPAVPVYLAADAEQSRTLTLRLAQPLAPGRYELVVRIGTSGGPVQELASFGIEVAPDGVLSLGSGSLGSTPFGSGS